ncbi:MAG: PqqD family protein, partial [Pirellulaceae bacterium]
MSRFLSSLVSASRRPLLLHMRADLTVQQQEYLGRQYRVIKDPLTLKYYRFEEEEYAILEMLDGKASLEELRHRFEQRFAPQKITLQELHRLIGMLHQASLIVSDSPGQGAQLLRRKRERLRRERFARFTNILSVRFPGFDPDRLLARLNGSLGRLFTVPACAAWGALA